MATRMVTELQDDIDGSNATQTIQFALEGIEYEIDLSDRNANRLRGSLAEFIGHARKVSGRHRGKAAPSAQTDKSQASAMRDWLKQHGYEVADRGRIPDWLQRAYHDHL
jgi:Lsr2